MAIKTLKELLKAHENNLFDPAFIGVDLTASPFLLNAYTLRRVSRATVPVYPVYVDEDELAEAITDGAQSRADEIEAYRKSAADDFADKRVRMYGSYSDITTYDQEHSTVAYGARSETSNVGARSTSDSSSTTHAAPDVTTTEHSFDVAGSPVVEPSDKVTHTIPTQTVTGSSTAAAATDSRSETAHSDETTKDQHSVSTSHGDKRDDEYRAFNDAEKAAAKAAAEAAIYGILRQILIEAIDAAQVSGGWWY